MRFSLLTGMLVVLLACGTSIAEAQVIAPPADQTSAGTNQSLQTPQSPDLAMWITNSAAAAPAAVEPIARRDARSRTFHKLANRIASRILSRTSSVAAGLTRSALRFLGTPYVFGGTSAGGFDCSGYVQHVFGMMGIRLPRTADAQFYALARVRGSVTAGDLVFFQTYERGPSHVGIYLGKGSFVHSSSHGVMVSRMHDSYWANRYIGAKRVAIR